MASAGALRLICHCPIPQCIPRQAFRSSFLLWAVKHLVSRGCPGWFVMVCLGGVSWEWLLCHSQLEFLAMLLQKACQ